MSSYSSYKIGNEITKNKVCFASFILSKYNFKELTIIIEFKKLEIFKEITKEDLINFVEDLINWDFDIELEINEDKKEFYIHLKSDMSTLEKRLLCLLIRVLYEGYDSPNYDLFYNIYFHYKNLKNLNTNIDKFILFLIGNNLTFVNNKQNNNVNLSRNQFLFNTNHLLGQPYCKLLNSDDLKNYKHNSKNYYVNEFFNSGLNKNELENYSMKDNSSESYLEVLNKLNLL